MGTKYQGRYFELGYKTAVRCAPRSVSTRRMTAALVTLLSAAVGVSRMGIRSLEKRDKVAVAVLVAVLILSGYVLLTGGVFTPSPTPSDNNTITSAPSYDNTTMTLGPKRPKCPSMDPGRISFDEEEFSLENGTLGNHTEEEVREAILSEIEIKDENFESEFRKVREEAERVSMFPRRLEDSLKEAESNETNGTAVDTPLELGLSENETRRLIDAFEDAVAVEEPDQHYPQLFVDAQELPSSSGINETLEILEEEYGIGNPTVSDSQPRRIKFGNKNIDVQERYHPDRYYVVRGVTSRYENTHLVIVREGISRETLLVQFGVGDC